MYNPRLQSCYVQLLSKSYLKRGLTRERKASKKKRLRFVVLLCSFTDLLQKQNRYQSTSIAKIGGVLEVLSGHR